MDIVSACLIGCNCKWNGENNKREDPRFEGCIPVCPEMFGGMGIPRGPSEIREGKIITKDGKDVTEGYREGAKEATEFALACGAKRAFLKERSPSCGVNQIYDGSFCGKIIPGEGVFAKMLRENGIEVIGVE